MWYLYISYNNKYNNKLQKILDKNILLLYHWKLLYIILFIYSYQQEYRTITKIYKIFLITSWSIFKILSQVDLLIYLSIQCLDVQFILRSYYFRIVNLWDLLILQINFSYENCILFILFISFLKLSNVVNYHLRDLLCIIFRIFSMYISNISKYVWFIYI